MKAALGFAAFSGLMFSACFDFGADLDACKAVGKCVDPGTGSGGGGGVEVLVNRVDAGLTSLDFGRVARLDLATRRQVVGIDGDAGELSFTLDSAAQNAGFSVAPACAAPTNACELTVSFTSGLPVGPAVGALFVDGGAAGSALVALSATRIERFSLETPSLDFGDVTLNQPPVPKTVRLLHAASSPTALTYGAPASFVFSTECATLDAGTCDFAVTFRPLDAGTVSESLTLTDPAGHVETLALTGRAFPPSEVVFTPSPLAFGVVDAGSRVTAAFSAQNTGTLPVSFTVALSGAPAFGLDAGTCSVGSLAPDASCGGEVSFLAEDAGTVSGQVTFAAFTPAFLALSGTGRVTRTLTVRSDGGTVSSGAPVFTCANCTQAFDELATAPQVTLTAAPSSGLYGLGAWGGSCSGTVASACTLTMDRDRLVSADFARIAEPVTVTVSPAGGGSVSGVAGPSCGPSCFSLPAGTVLSLGATPARGYTFAGWSGGAVSCGQDASCTLSVADGGVSVGATFAQFNYAFTTRSAFPSTEVRQADQHCTNAARDAGLPGSYLAFVMGADGGTLARFAAWRGWRRTDEQPFLDTIDGGLSRTVPVVFYPPSLDEFGQTLPPQEEAWTGLNATGGLANCVNWTDTGAGATMTAPGRVWSTAQTWYDGPLNGDCSGTRHLYCLGTGAVLPTRPPPPPSGAILMFVTSTTTTGDNDGGQCALDAADAGLLTTGRGVSVFRALAFSSATDLSGIMTPPARPIYRPDGVLLYSSNTPDGGYGLPPPAGLNVLARGVGLPWSSTSAAWLGAQKFSNSGTLLDTCSDWTSAAASALSPPFILETDQGGGFVQSPGDCPDTRRTLCVVR